MFCTRLLLTCVLAGSLPLAGASASLNDSVQRLRPPESIKCSRDRLTAFQGNVIEYQRAKQDISLRVRTDEDTTERFSLKWAANEQPDTWLLTRGQAFKPEDWKLIESAPGNLLEGTRVIVWVCDDGSKPVIDWRPKERGPGLVSANQARPVFFYFPYL